MTNVDAPPASTLRSQHRGPAHFTRSLGPTAPQRMTLQPEVLTRFVTRESGPWCWRNGVGGTDQRRYEMPALARPLLRLCFVGSAASKRRRSALHSIGAALARLHNEVPVSALPGLPPALNRLARFLTPTALNNRVDPEPPGHEVDARRQRVFLSALRTGLRQELLDQCCDAMTNGGGVFSHGWLGLDKWFVSPIGGIGLIGEDIGIAAREHDLGSIFAQVLEYQRLTEGLVTQTDLERDKVALLTGYGTPIDECQFSREVRLAICRHIADYAVHTRGPESELVRYAQMINSLGMAA